MEQRTVKPKETWAQAITRLALQARENDVTIYVYDIDGPPQYFATSIGQPGRLYRVSAFSCQCRGFIAHQKCQHHSALLAFIGELPPLPEPPDPAALAQRRAERIQTWQENNLVHANTLLAAVIAKQDAGETVPYAQVREAVDAVATYQAATSTPVALAA